MYFGSPLTLPCKRSESKKETVDQPRTCLVSWSSLEISTLSCMPKTSGVWDKGSSCNQRRAFRVNSMEPIHTFTCIGIYLDKLHVLIVRTLWRHIVNATLWKLVLRILYNVWGVEVRQDTHKTPSEAVKWRNNWTLRWRLYSNKPFLHHWGTLQLLLSHQKHTQINI